MRERGYDAVTLIDVDGMKKLLGFPPAIVFMLLERFCGVCTTPENDVMGNVTQLMVRYLTGQVAHYMEYYEYFKESMLIGVPDYIPIPAIEGNVELLPTAFGLLDASLLNVSKVKTGYVTCARLYYKKGRYYMHIYTGEAKQPPKWEEYGLGASCAAAAKSGSLPRFLHGARVCAAGIQPARNCVLRERGAGAQRTVRPIGHCGGILIRAVRKVAHEIPIGGRRWNDGF